MAIPKLNISFGGTFFREKAFSNDTKEQLINDTIYVNAKDFTYDVVETADGEKYILEQRYWGNGEISTNIFNKNVYEKRGERMNAKTYNRSKQEFERAKKIWEG